MEDKRTRRSYGFTRLELFILVSVVVVLITVFVPLLPCFSRSYVHTSDMVCSWNQRDLTMGLLVYINDIGDILPSSDTFDNENYSNWVRGPIDVDGTYVEWKYCSQEDEIRGLKKSILWMYSDDVMMYSCPSKKNRMNDKALGYRSYSMPSTLNGTFVPEDMKGHVFRKLSRIKDQSKKFLLVEEADTRGFNYNGWFQDPDKKQVIIDSVGVFHDDKSCFAFVDGHIEVKKMEKGKYCRIF